MTAIGMRGPPGSGSRRCSSSALCGAGRPRPIRFCFKFLPISAREGAGRGSGADDAGGGLRSRRDAGGHLRRPDRRGERGAGRGRASGGRSMRARSARVAFAGGRAMLRAGLGRVGGGDEAEVDRLYPRLLELYGAALAVHTRLYDGAEAALDAAGGATAGRWRSAPTSRRGWRRCCWRRSGSPGGSPRCSAPTACAFRKPDPRHLLETIARAGGTPGAGGAGRRHGHRPRGRAGAGVPCVLVGFGPEGAAVRGWGRR